MKHFNSVMGPWSSCWIKTTLWSLVAWDCRVLGRVHLCPFWQATILMRPASELLYKRKNVSHDFVPDLNYQYHFNHLHYSYEDFYDFCSVHMSCNWAVCVLSYFFFQRMKRDNMMNQLDIIYEIYQLPVYLISGVQKKNYRQKQVLFRALLWK